MITVLHGENEVSSRDKLTQLIQTAQATNKTIQRLDAKRLDLAALESALSANSLFGEDRLVIIDKLHSLPRSKKKTQLIELVSKFANATGLNIILWEKRSLTPTMIKKINPDKLEEFKTSSDLFKWLDSLDGGKRNIKHQLSLLEKASNNDGEQICFAMLIRQIRLLITAREGSPVKGHPFVVQKVNSQAKKFELSQLLQIHRQLLTIDQKMKTSTNLLSLKAEMDLLLLNS